MNERINKLEALIQTTWREIQQQSLRKDRTAVQSALDKIANLEGLKQQELTLQRSIEAASTSNVANGSADNKAAVSEATFGFTMRKKRSSNNPREIGIGPFRKHISQSNEILVTIANWIIGQGKILPTVPNFIHPTDAGFLRSAVRKQLNSGQYIEMGDDQEHLVKKSRRLLDEAGFREQKVEVIFVNGTTKVF